MRRRGRSSGDSRSSSVLRKQKTKPSLLQRLLLGWSNTLDAPPARAEYCSAARRLPLDRRHKPTSCYLLLMCSAVKKASDVSSMKSRKIRRFWLGATPFRQRAGLEIMAFCQIEKTASKLA